MARVIKAEQTKRISGEPYIMREEEQTRAEIPGFVDDLPDSPDTEAQPEEAAPQDGLTREERERRQEWQAIYDELQETASNEAALLLEDARREAEEIRQEARDEGERLLQEAMVSGAEEGFSIGYQEGREEARREGREAQARGQAQLREAMDEVYAHRDRLLEEMEPQVLMLALTAAEKIIGHELSRDSTVFRDIVTEALRQLSGESRVALHVTLSDYVGVFQSQKKARFTTEGGKLTVEIQTDPNLDSGEILLETETGLIDASPKAQLEQMANTLGI